MNIRLLYPKCASALSSTFLLCMLSGCHVTEPEPQTMILCGTPTEAELCESIGLRLAYEDECMIEGICTEITRTLCDINIVVQCTEDLNPVCHDEFEVNPSDVCSNEGLILASEEECEMDASCQSFQRPDACGMSTTIFCRPEITCDEGFSAASLICESEGLIEANDEECASRDDCREVTLDMGCQAGTVLCRPDPTCDETGRIEDSEICGAQGLIPATEAECEGDAGCTTISTEGGCGMFYDTLCKPAILCDAPLECSEGREPSSNECTRGELGCELVTGCDEAISCRPTFVCDAAPSCDEGEAGSRFGCEEGEAGCRAVEVCNETIFCRPQEDCEAVPGCPEGQVESLNPCLATETQDECRAVTFCSMTIACRAL